MENVLSHSHEPNKRVKETENVQKQMNPMKTPFQSATLSKASVAEMSEKKEPSWIQEGIRCADSS